jgi:methylglutaconyl-CoA hydratase
MSEQPVLWQTDSRGVATVALNRPKVNNAYDEAMLRGLHEAMDALLAAREVRVVVLRGAGRHFQAGADLGWISSLRAQSAEANEHASRLTATAVRRLNELPVPTVALVQGACFGGGTGIVAACDIVIAADDALFSIAETRWGLMAGIILPQLADAIGARQVRRYALSGERFGAEEARRIGLVHLAVPAAQLAAAGETVVRELLQNAPEANAATKAAALEFAWGVPAEAVLERLITGHAARRRSAEAGEGLASFREKRPARWST